MKNPIRSVLALLLLISANAVNAQVPKMNSYPSANAVIFLDFDGHLVSGTSWNFNGPFECAPTTLDNTKITEVFNRVAEDFRPFNINVTTDSTKYLSAPATRRMRVILTVSSSWYGNAGGVAFLNSFTWGDNTPCFVFTALLSNNVKNISEAVSHETGHTLGLYHQASYDANCVKLTDYHQGTGSGEIGWAPIMGVGYYRNFTLWHNGSNANGCNVTQSDLSIITNATNGFGYRTDDYNSTFNNAQSANFNNQNQFTVNGIVERTGDQDLFRFTIPQAGGRFQLNAIPYNVGTGNSGSNLDMQVTLYNSSQVALNVYNPGTLLSSVVDTLLNSGTYYLMVEGKGNQFAPSYASLGSYSLQGIYSIGGTLPLHKLELRGNLNGDKHQLSWEIIADEQITDLDVEVSTDGRNFHPLTQTPNDARSYIYRPSVPVTAQYRLHVTFDNGRDYYSNIVTIRHENAPRPTLVGNLISGSMISVSSPGNFRYSIHDLTGRIVTSGTIVSGMNMLNASSMKNGMYIIRFSDDDQQWTDKLVKQ